MEFSRDSLVRACSRLQLRRGLVHQLCHNAPNDFLDDCPMVLIESVQLGTMPTQLFRNNASLVPEVQ